VPHQPAERSAREQVLVGERFRLSLLGHANQAPRDMQVEVSPPDSIDRAGFEWRRRLDRLRGSLVLIARGSDRNPIPEEPERSQAKWRFENARPEPVFK